MLYDFIQFLVVKLQFFMNFGIIEWFVNLNFFFLKLQFECLVCFKYIIIFYIILGFNLLVFNDFYDSNIILVELIFQLVDDIIIVIDGFSYSFDVDVEYGSDGSKKSFFVQMIVVIYDKIVVNFV